MPAINPSWQRLANKQKQHGVAAVEFSLVAILFFTLVFGIIEVARAMYICNTLQEVTRRAAALATNADFRNDAIMQDVRERAIFRNSPGLLVFAEPITDQHINIDYMRVRRDGGNLTMERIPDGSLPASPAQNRVNCTRDPYAEGCIRLVRVRVCQPGGGAECTPVPYRTLVSLIPLPFALPRSTTIANAETLGML
jgi:hypothetical protein